MVARHWLYFGGFVIAGTLLIGAGLMGLLDALSVLSGGAYYSEELALMAMLGEAAEWIVAGLVFGVFAAVFLVATVVSVLRNGSLPRSDRLVAVVERLEREYPLLRQFDASERVEPTVEDRRRRLQERYVAGEIDDEEFERELDRLMGDDRPDERRRTGTDAAVDVEERS